MDSTGLRRSLGSGTRKALAAIWPAALLVIAWEVCAALSNSRFVPHIHDVAQITWTSLWGHPIIRAQGGDPYGYFVHIGTTIESLGIAMIVGGGLAFAIAVTLDPFPAGRLIFNLSLRPWHVVPPLIVVPLLLALLGPSWVAYRIAASLYAFVATAVVTGAALSDVPPSFVHLAQLAGAGPLWIAWRVRAIAILPMLIGPLKVVASFTLGIVVILEYLAAPMGIGRVMRFAVSYNAVALILAGIFWAAMIGFAFGFVVDHFGGHLLRWAPRARADATSLSTIQAAHHFTRSQGQP